MKTESNRVDRLVGLCKLWGAIKVFHPYLAYRQDIDWDAALVGAIPQVSEADSAGEYAAAVQSMLNALGDPVTQVVPQKPAATAPPASGERQPSYTFTPDGILVVTMHHYADLSDFHGASEKMNAIKQEVARASGILFDLRASAPLSQEKGDWSFQFRYSEIASLLSTTPLVTPGERSRMHLGYAPQLGATSGGYGSAFRVMDGYRIAPAPEGRDMPVVFLINAWSELPPEALALQLAGKAGVVFEDDPADTHHPNNASLIVSTHRIPLSDGVVAEIRLGETICQDGSGGLLPDQIVTPAQLPSEADAALEAALAFLKDFQPRKMRRTPLPAHAVPAADNAYPEMAYPAPEYRLLAAFRIWTVINYFFPYKDLMGEDWDGVLQEFIPRMEQADSALSYHLAVAEMITHIHDSHGYVYSPVLSQHFGSAWPPVRIQMVENAAVITSLLDEEIAKTAGISCGDVVLLIDGEDALERIAERAKYKSASTPQSLMHQAAFTSLSGPEDSVILLTVRDREQRVKEVKLPRKPEYRPYGMSERNGEVVRLLTEDIGYADLNRLEVPAVDEMFEKFKHTQAIILDMRGYPRMTAWSIAPRLSAENGVGAAQFQRPLVMTPDGPSGEITIQPGCNAFVQSIPFTEKWRYQGKTVMLIDERAISQSEHSGLFFEAANGTNFIGSHTAGANGDVTNFNAPGGLVIGFTGQSVRHVDGRQLQRIGLAPDIEVRPTIQGLQNGQDEVLEAAVQYLQGEIGAGRLRPGV